jgi:hypothetical protein
MALTSSFRVKQHFACDIRVHLEATARYFREAVGDNRMQEFVLHGVFRVANCWRYGYSHHRDIPEEEAIPVYVAIDKVFRKVFRPRGVFEREKAGEHLEEFIRGIYKNFKKNDFASSKELARFLRFLDHMIVAMTKVEAKAKKAPPKKMSKGWFLRASALGRNDGGFRGFARA